MALSFIDNQPVRFTSDTQLCKNSDSRLYNTLLQNDDELCLQVRNTPCGENVFTCPMTELLANGSFGSATGWTLGTGWSIGSGVLTATNGSQDNSSYCSCTLVAGYFYLVTFTITAYTDGSVAPVLGDASGNTTGDFVSALGTNKQVLRYNDTEQTFQLRAGIAADFRGSIDNASVKALCFRSPLLDAETDWLYNTTTGVFTHVAGTDPLRGVGAGQAINGTPYQITFTVSGMTTGTLQPAFNDAGSDVITNYGTAISGNGTYTFYATPTADSQLAFVPSTTFDGSIDPDSISIKEMNYDHTIKLIDLDGNVFSETIDVDNPDNPIEYNEDVLTWCADWSTIASFDAPDVFTPTGCYRIRLTDDCESELYESNIINYINDEDSGHSCTVWVTATCEETGLGFDFSGSFSLNQRLRVLRITPKYPADTDQYIYSNGRHKRTFAQTEKVFIAWFDSVDEPTHDCINVQSLCDELMFDGVEYFRVSDSYEPEWVENGKMNLAKSRLEIVRVDKVLYNRNL